MDELITLLPPTQQRLASQRFKGGVEHPHVGRSVAHLRLAVAGTSFRKVLRALKGQRLGCFCGEGDRCHAAVLAELAELAEVAEVAKKAEVISTSEEASHEAASPAHAGQARKRKCSDDNPSPCQ